MIRRSIALSYRLSLLQAQIHFYLQKAVKCSCIIEAMSVVPQAMDAFQQFKIVCPRWVDEELNLVTVKLVFADMERLGVWLEDYVATHNQWWWDKDIVMTIRYDLPLVELVGEEMIGMVEALQSEHSEHRIYISCQWHCCTQKNNICYVYELILLLYVCYTLQEIWWDKKFSNGSKVRTPESASECKQM